MFRLKYGRFESGKFLLPYNDVPLTRQTAGANIAALRIASDGSIYILASDNIEVLIGSVIPVTLAGAFDYLTLLGQEITLHEIDLAADVTGILPDANVANNITLDNITQITNRSHTALSDIGTNSHAQIDSHIADGNIHFTEASLNLPTSYLAIDGGNANQPIDIQGQSLNVGNLGVGTAPTGIPITVKGSNGVRVIESTTADYAGLQVFSGGNLKIGLGTANKNIYMEGDSTGGGNLYALVQNRTTALNHSTGVSFASYTGFVAGIISSTVTNPITGEGYMKIVSRTSTGLNEYVNIGNGSGLWIKGTADEVQQIVQGNSIQNVNLTEWRDSSGVPLAYIEPNGTIFSTADIIAEGIGNQIIRVKSSSASAFFDIDRFSSASNIAEFRFKTNGTQYWAMGLDNDSTNNFYLKDASDNKFLSFIDNGITSFMGVNVETPLGGLHTGGDRVKSNETSVTTATVSDDVETHFCNGAGAYALTLPAQVAGKTVRIINKNTGVVTLTPASGLISGAATSALNQYDSLLITSDGTNWY